MTPQGFRSWRKSLLLTQEEAAHKLGVTVRAVALWEAGERPISRITELATRELSHQHYSRMNEMTESERIIFIRQGRNRLPKRKYAP